MTEVVKGNGGMCAESCGEGKCGHNCMGSGYGHVHALKWLIRITIMVIVFCVGVQFGELKGMLEMHERTARHGGAMMYGFDGTDGQPVQMMQGTVIAPSAAKTDTTTKTK